MEARLELDAISLLVSKAPSSQRPDQCLIIGRSVSLIQRDDAVPTRLYLSTLTVELTHVLCLAPSALAQDSEAEIPRDHFIISFLTNALRSHPDSERLIFMVYKLLTVISSQGECAVFFLSFFSTLKIQGLNKGLGRWAGEELILQDG